jgi:hypothetical protein
MLAVEASMLDAVTLAVFGGTALFLHWLLKEPANLPPGPRRWPLIGSLPTMARYPMEQGHLAMAALHKQYGGKARRLSRGIARITHKHPY